MSSLIFVFKGDSYIYLLLQYIQINLHIKIKNLLHKMLQTLWKHDLPNKQEIYYLKWRSTEVMNVTPG